MLHSFSTDPTQFFEATGNRYVRLETKNVFCIFSEEKNFNELI